MSTIVDRSWDRGLTRAAVFGGVVAWIVFVAASAWAASPQAGSSARPAAAVAGVDGSSNVSVASPEDLTRRLEEAVEARRAAPTAEHWHDEGAVLEQMGQYREARDAYHAERGALPPSAEAKRRAASSAATRVAEKSRGIVTDEPSSTHREGLDSRWQAEEKAATQAEEGGTPPDPSHHRLTRGAITRKWYFWVTLAAIAASGAAVAGIAIKASQDKRSDALDTNQIGSYQMAPGLRF